MDRLVRGGLSGPNTANAFSGNFAAEGVAVDFNWGNYSAWERDFKDPTKGGDDSNWVDEVDAVFFDGHGNGNGIGFCSSVDDTFLHYSEALWGNLDLEWLGRFACSVLSLETGEGEWWQRWGPAFDGLHLLSGFSTTVYDVPSGDDGRLYAQIMLGRGFPWSLIGPQPVRVAWSLMSIFTQPSSVTHSTMGVIGPGGLANLNDYWWGKGPTGPDIRGTHIHGYWMVLSSS